MSELENADPRRGKFPCPRCARVLLVPNSGDYFLPLVWPSQSTVKRAMRGYVCEQCGPIPFSELPSDAKVIRVLMFVAALCVLFFVIVLIVGKFLLP